jgi:hypothetical protein
MKPGLITGILKHNRSQYNGDMIHPSNEISDPAVSGTDHGYDFFGVHKEFCVCTTCETWQK